MLAVVLLLAVAPDPPLISAQNDTLTPIRGGLGILTFERAGVEYRFSMLDPRCVDMFETSPDAYAKAEKIYQRAAIGMWMFLGGLQMLAGAGIATPFALRSRVFTGAVLAIAIIGAVLINAGTWVSFRWADRLLEVLYEHNA